MGLPRGLRHFTAFFKEFENDYVIIGGGAASVCLEDEKLEFRATKDIDMVLFTNDFPEFNKKISEYVFLGKYQQNEKTQEAPSYYRFSRPMDQEFPEIVEIFAKASGEIVLREGQYIIPIQNNSEAQLSAILLDDEYFNLIRSNSIKSEGGYSVINPFANICLKARAFKELQERNEEPKKIRKHLKDVLRLTLALKKEKFLLEGKPREDFEKVYAALEELEDKEVKQVIGDLLSKEDVLDILNKSVLCQLWF